MYNMASLEVHSKIYPGVDVLKHDIGFPKRYPIYHAHFHLSSYLLSLQITVKDELHNYVFNQHILTYQTHSWRRASLWWSNHLWIFQEPGYQ